MVSASESLGMPFAIVVNLEDFTVSVGNPHSACRRSAGELTSVTCLSPGHHRRGCGVGGGAGPVDGDDPGVGQSVSVGILPAEPVETSGSESFCISGKFLAEEERDVHATPVLCVVGITPQ